MKRVLLIVLLASCKNPKADIVEQEKKLQGEIGAADAGVSYYNIQAERYAMFKRRALTTKEMDTAMMFQDTASMYRVKKARLQGQYDSLEMELKKY